MGADAPARRVEAAVQAFLSRAEASAPSRETWLRTCAEAPCARLGCGGARTSGTAPTVLGQHRHTYIVATRRRGPAARGPAHRPRARSLRAAARQLEPQRRWSRSCCSCPSSSSSRPRCGRCSRRAARLSRAGLRRRGVRRRLDSRPRGAGAARDARSRTAPRARCCATCSSASAATGSSRARATVWPPPSPATPRCAPARPWPREHDRDRARPRARPSQPLLCPHGRPTIVRIPREDVSRWFGRTGWRRQ